MTELTRREKEAGIRPEPEVDLFMKVRTRKNKVTFVSMRKLVAAAKHQTRTRHEEASKFSCRVLCFFEGFSCRVQIMLPNSKQVGLRLLQTTEPVPP